MTIKIEKGVTIPPRKNGAPTEFTKALAAMKVGNSIFVKVPKSAQRTTYMWVYNNKRPERFTTRKMDGGTRIWRIK
jgi:hypothetical protein